MSIDRTTSRDLHSVWVQGLQADRAAAGAWYSFPESMLKALGLSEENALPPSPSPPQPAPGVPILLLVPATPSALSPSSALVQPRSQRGVDAGALSCLLEVTTPMSVGKQAVWPPAPSCSTDSDVSDSDALPSFGDRTAAAKAMLSAAPGGPVRGYSGTSKFPDKDQHAKGIWKTLTADAFDHSFFSHSCENQFLKRRQSKKEFCPFCKKNGESPMTYTGHTLRKKINGTFIVTCPQLRRVECGYCGATGDVAHTKTHCPEGPDKLPVAVLLKSTPRRCDGSLRQ